MRTTFLEALKLSIGLFKIMIPMSILVRILDVLGIIEILGKVLEPLMELMGLPGNMAVVWAAGMGSFYAGVATFTSLAPGTQLTIGQVTILLSLILVAHSLPVELRIAQKAGARARAMFVLRVGGAFLFGWGLHKIYRLFHYLQEDYSGIWTTLSHDLSWGAWAIAEIAKYGMIFVILICLLMGMKVLYHLGITSFLTGLLGPLLSRIGISDKAAPITIVGMTLGMTYGGGLIIQESNSGNLELKDIFASLTLMGLSHGLIEDTLLMLALGGHASGVIWGRLLFTILMTYFVVNLLKQLRDKDLNRFIFRP
jgi:spore maturation protein SpmB